MGRIAFFVGSIWIVSLGGLFSEAGTEVITPSDAGAIVGADTGWCRATGACNALNASCNSDESCEKDGDKCGVTREAKSPESCDPEYGNDNCNS